MTPRNPDREVAGRLAKLLAVFLAGQIDRGELAAEMRKLAARVESAVPIALTPVGPDTRGEAVERIHAAWQSVMGGEAALTPARKRKVLARLERYTEAQIVRAIKGCAGSDFHMGKNDSKTRYNSLELICRSDEKLEEFLRRAADNGVSDLEVGKEAERLQRAAEEALGRGDFDGYQRANAALAGMDRGTRAPAKRS